MAEMPDLRTLAYLASFVHIGRLMDKIIYHLVIYHVPFI